MNIFAKVKRRIRVWKELSVNHSNIVEKYKDKKESVDFVNKPAPIWVCWLQGEENAPEVVKSCIRSIRENNKKHPINFISMNNISDYIEIPEIILEKWKKKQISPTHFSDYIRSALLAKFGGIWMDATLFCVQELPEEFFSMPFFPGTKYKSIGIRRFKGGLLGFWTTYFMGSNLKNSIIFSF